MDNPIFLQLQEKYGSKFCYPEIQTGWENLVIELYSELDVYIQQGLIVDQIKTKFGGLRVYFTFPDTEDKNHDSEYEQVMAIISKYEKMASKTCECCGSNENIERVSIRYWISTYCNNCKEYYSKANNK